MRALERRRRKRSPCPHRRVQAPIIRERKRTNTTPALRSSGLYYAGRASRIRAVSLIIVFKPRDRRVQSEVTTLTVWQHVPSPTTKRSVRQTTPDQEATFHRESQEREAGAREGDNNFLDASQMHLKIPSELPYQRARRARQQWQSGTLKCLPNAVILKSSCGSRTTSRVAVSLDREVKPPKTLKDEAETREKKRKKPGVHK